MFGFIVYFDISSHVIKTKFSNCVFGVKNKLQNTTNQLFSMLYFFKVKVESQNQRIFM